MGTRDEVPDDQWNLRRPCCIEWHQFNFSQWTSAIIIHYLQWFSLHVNTQRLRIFGYGWVTTFSANTIFLPFAISSYKARSVPFTCANRSLVAKKSIWGLGCCCLSLKGMRFENHLWALCPVGAAIHQSKRCTVNVKLSSTTPWS